MSKLAAAKQKLMDDSTSDWIGESRRLHSTDLKFGEGPSPTRVSEWNPKGSGAVCRAIGFEGGQSSKNIRIGGNRGIQ